MIRLDFYAMTFEELQHEMEKVNFTRAELESMARTIGRDSVIDDMKRLARKKGLIRAIMEDKANPEQSALLRENRALKAKLTEYIESYHELGRRYSSVRGELYHIKKEVA